MKRKSALLATLFVFIFSWPVFVEIGFTEIAQNENMTHLELSEEEAASHGRISHDGLKIFIDTDMGLDDVRSLFALLNASSMDILGIITVEGSTSIGKGADNLIGLIEATPRNTIPTYRGYASPDSQQPPWRNTANQVGGVPFPPPRKLSPFTDPCEKIINLINKSEEEIHYLALGPLSNLARLETHHPDILAKLNTIWIPVTITQDGQLEGWNLLYDLTSATKVLSKTANIVLIDLSGTNELNGCKALSLIKGSSTAAKWIENLTANLCPGNGHIMISDELAAAVVIDPGLITFSKERFTPRRDDKALIKILPDKNGSIAVARLKDLSRVMDLLKTLWEQPRKDTDMHEHNSPIPAKTLLKTFHGHLGPYVVLGYRMGKLGLKVLESEGHFGISAEVHSHLKPPQSCLIDGLQLGSGCTLGKRNITIHEFNGPAYAILKTKEGRAVIIRLRAEIPNLVSQLIDEKGVEAAGEDLLKRDVESLFEVERKQEGNS